MSTRILSPHLPSQIQFLRVSYYFFECLRAICLILGLYYCLPSSNTHQHDDGDGFSTDNNHTGSSHPVGIIVFVGVLIAFYNVLSSSSPVTHKIQQLLSNILSECHDVIYYSAASHISVFAGGNGGGTLTASSSASIPLQQSNPSPIPSLHSPILNFASTNQSSIHFWRRALAWVVFWGWCVLSAIGNVLSAARRTSGASSATTCTFSPLASVSQYFAIYRTLLWGKGSQKIDSATKDHRQLASGSSQAQISHWRKGIIVIKEALSRETFYMMFHCILLALWIGSMVLYMRILPFQSVLLLTLMQPIVFFFIQNVLFNVQGVNHRSSKISSKSSLMNLRNDFVNNVIFFIILSFAALIPHGDTAFLPVRGSSELFSNIFALLLMFVSNMSRALYRNHTLNTMRMRAAKVGASAKKHRITPSAVSDATVAPKSSGAKSPSESLFRRQFQSKQQYDNFISFTLCILLTGALFFMCTYYGLGVVLKSLFSSFWPALVFVISFFTLPSIFGHSTHLLKASLIHYESSGTSHSSLAGHNSSSFMSTEKDLHSAHSQLNSQSGESFVPHHDATNIHLFIFSIFVLLIIQNVHILTLISLVLLFIFFHRAYRLHRKNSKSSSSMLPGVHDYNYNSSAQSSIFSFIWSFVQYSESYLDATTVTSDSHIFNKVTSSLRTLMQDRESRNLLLFLILNVAFMFVELGYGLMTDSLGLISDAAHMFFDSASLFVGLYGQYMVKWQKDKVFTYGYGRYEILSGFINGLLLVFISIYLMCVSISRLIDPPRIEGSQLLTVSIMGFLLNLMGVINFYQSDPNHENQNIYGVYLHMIADALGSVGVILSTCLIQYFQVYRADPLCSMAMSILILTASLPLLKHNGLCLMQATPPDMHKNLEDAVAEIQNLPEVEQVREAFFWTMNQNHHVGTLKIQLRDLQEEEDAAVGVVLGAVESRQLVLQKSKNILSPLVKDLCIDVN